MKTTSCLISMITGSFLFFGIATAQDSSVETPPPSASCDHTSIMKVIKKNSRKKLRKFFEKNPDYDVTCIDKDGNTPLISGASRGFAGAYKTVPILLERGVDPNVVNNYGQTAFLIYSQYEYYRDDINPRLILAKAGADIKAVDNFGFNAAHFAALGHSRKAFIELRNGGVDVNALSKNGSNAYDIAEYAGRVLGLQPSINLGDANLQYYNLLNTLKSSGLGTTKRFEGYKLTRNSGEAVVSKTPKPKKKPGGLLGVLNSAIVKSEGTGRKCNHVLVIGNFTGMPLIGQIQAKLENGRFQEYSDRAGGKFNLPTGGVAKHQIWLTQGGNQRLFIGAGGLSSRADYIDFSISPECPHSERSLSSRSFVVEKNNSNGMLSIFEDTNGDGKRDSVAPSNIAQPPSSSGDQCGKIDLLATKINEASTAMAYDDTQLAGLYTATSCTMSDAVSKQRAQISNILSPQ